MAKEKIIAVDIGASKIRIQAVDTEYNLGPEKLINLVGLNLDNDKFIQLLTDGIQTVMDSEKDSNFLAISIGSPGPLDPFKGIIEETPNLKGIKGLNIVDELKAVLKLPVFLLNDADAAGLGEWWLGSGRGCKNFVYITLSTGVGSSLLINGELQRGLGKAPEWGHTSLFIENDQRHCNCGQWNCVEAYLGTEGLAKTYAKIFGIKIADMSSEDKYSISFKVKDGIKNNDTPCLKVEDEYSKHLASFIRNLVLVHQPEAITLGGGIIFNNEHLLSLTKNKLKELMDPEKDKMGVMLEGVWLHLAKFENAVNLGTVKYALKQLEQGK